MKYEFECKKCKYCNLKKYYRGEWYCNNPKVSIFDLTVDPGKCFEKREQKGRVMSRVLPILFNTDMVRAILDGSKTVTRRLVMPHNRKKAKEQGYCQESGLWVDPGTDNGDKEGHIKDYSVSPCWMSYSWYINRYAPFKPGDLIYIRETWCSGYDGEAYFYLADKNTEREQKQLIDYDNRRWRPSIHMPKEAARIWLKVTNVRVERLQDMKLNDFLDEGVVIRPEAFNDPDNAYMQAKNEFIAIWDSTIPKRQQDLYSWTANPRVWAIKFEQCEKPESKG